MSHLLKVSLEDNFTSLGFPSNVSGPSKPLCGFFAVSVWT